MNIPDIRRTVNVRGPVTGQEITAALRVLAEQINQRIGREDYEVVERLHSDYDGKELFALGIFDNGKTNMNMIIRTGSDLETTGIDLTRTYVKWGVGSVDWPENAAYQKREDQKQYSTDFGKTQDMDGFKNQLEKILNESTSLFLR